jgi:hypothetical protein
MGTESEAVWDEPVTDRELDEVEREWREELAEERRKLRELAREVPGPDTPDPRDKIWRWLIAEYGFDPPTLWRMTIRDMRRYVEARRPVTNRLPEVAKEDWRPASEALDVARQKGYDITLDWISKRKGRICTRPRQLPGRHQLEVEMGSLGRVLFSEAIRHAGNANLDEPDESEREQIEARKRTEQERRRRPLA